MNRSPLLAIVVICLAATFTDHVIADSRSASNDSLSKAVSDSEALDDDAVYERAKELYFDESAPDNKAASANLLIGLAKRGHIKAQLHLGSMYRDGDGVPRNSRLAVEWWTKAAMRSDSEACLQLGMLLEQGAEGLPADKVAGLKWINKAVELGNASAGAILGFRMLSDGSQRDLTKAAALLTKAAEQGHPMAQVQVAEMYRDGQGVKKDDREAFHWYQKAADQGIADGKLGLANMYRTGTFVEKNPKKALALYEEAQSEAGGLYYKGLMYTTGEGVEKDAAVGRELIYSAAKRGYSDAQVSIGELYKSGTGGMLQDFREAARWFSLAAKQGNVTGQHELAVMYWDGSGVEKSRVTAYAWINLACRSNGQLAKAARARWESQLTESELEQAQILSREWSIHTMVPVVPDNE